MIAELPLISMPAGYGSGGPVPTQTRHVADRARSGRPGRPAGLGGQQVDHVVHPVARVALHPPEGDRSVRVEGQGEQDPPTGPGWPPASPVSCASPAAATRPTTLAEAVDHVGRVAHHVQRPGQRLEGPDHRGDLHPLVGGVGLAARCPTARRRPPTPTRRARGSRGRTRRCRRRSSRSVRRSGRISSGQHARLGGRPCPARSAPPALDLVPGRRAVGAWERCCSTV